MATTFPECGSDATVFVMSFMAGVAAWRRDGVMA
jgi:hypothetical protein